MAHSLGVQKAMESAEILEKEGISCEVTKYSFLVLLLLSRSFYANAKGALVKLICYIDDGDGDGEVVIFLTI